MEATTVMAYHQCQGLEPGVSRLSFDDLALIRGSTLLSETGGKERNVSTTEPELILVGVSKGPQPTPGYALQLPEPVSQPAAATFHVELVWSTPDPDSVLAQVLTYPCLVLGVSGPVQTISVTDQNGVIGSLELKNSLELKKQP
jgi:hypothetical protein